MSELLEIVGADGERDEKTMLTTVSKQAPSPLGTLEDLPLELRRAIYGNVVEDDYKRTGE